MRIRTLSDAMLPLRAQHFGQFFGVAFTVQKFDSALSPRLLPTTTTSHVSSGSAAADRTPSRSRTTGFPAPAATVCGALKTLPARRNSCAAPLAMDPSAHPNLACYVRLGPPHGCLGSETTENCDDGTRAAKVGRWMQLPDPSLPLHNRNVVLGISGGIAAYKAAELTRLLRKAGLRSA